ncbi:hypothetical protein ACIA5D_48960 [Actinoplanes sp. NPDC051513]|uniref:hypothetical protein n=1 Tax=Actinoplanes sp. NPDC051513 TaxID=3363908 RepID=UPI0037A0281B
MPAYAAQLQETLLIQCRSEQALSAAATANTEGCGLVITAAGHRGYAGQIQAFRAASHLRNRLGFQRPLLLDAERYTGKNRLTAAAEFDQGWISRQRELGLPVLTDSGYVAEGDDTGVGSILERTAALGDAIALLPLHLSWLRNPGATTNLADQIATAGLPVALVLEHKDDPFGLVGVAASLMRIIEAGPPVLLLRCDISAVGSLCAGALAAAVGTTTSLRHLYPAPKDGGGGGGSTESPMIAAVIRECMAYINLAKILFAAKADPEDVLWQCDCDACLRVPISQLALHPEERQEELAFIHSVTAVLELRAKLLTPGSTRAQRLASWQAHCQQAQVRHMEIEATTDRFDPPTALRRWQEALAQLNRKHRVR